MDPKKLRKTTIDNVYVYVEDDFDLVGGRQEKYTFYDFSNIQPINVDSDICHKMRSKKYERKNL